MKLCAKVLWRVPVYCILCGFIINWITVLIGVHFFRDVTAGDDGINKVTINYTNLAIWYTVLFVILLLSGGLMLFRSMTKAEIAISAGIITVLFLLVTALQINSTSVIYMRCTGWLSTLETALYQFTQQQQLSNWLPCLTPLLFIPFGKKADAEATPPHHTS